MSQPPSPPITLTRSEGERPTRHGMGHLVERSPSLALRVSAWTIALMCVATLFCQFSPAIAADGDSVQLAYKFQPNQSLHFDYSQDMTMHLRKKVFKQKIQSQTYAAKHLRVISVDGEGNALIEPVIDRARLSSTVDDGAPTTFDSADGEDECPAAYRAILATIGKPLVRIKFARTGKVLSATGINGGGAAAEGLENDASLNFLIVLPEIPVKVGDTWKDDFEVNAQIDKTLKQGVKLRREYRLTKLDDSRAEIELKTGAITPINNPDIELQIAGRILTGMIVFDHQAGQIVSREVRVDREVINALGDGSLVHTSMTQSEQAVKVPKLANREMK